MEPIALTSAQAPRLMRFIAFILLKSRINDLSEAGKLTTCSLWRNILYFTSATAIAVIAAGAIAAGVTYSIIVHAIMGFIGGVWEPKAVMAVMTEVLSGSHPTIWYAAAAGETVLLFTLIIGFIVAAGFAIAGCMIASKWISKKFLQHQERLRLESVKAGVHTPKALTETNKIIQAWHGRYCVPIATEATLLHNDWVKAKEAYHAESRVGNELQLELNLLAHPAVSRTPTSRERISELEQLISECDARCDPLKAAEEAAYNAWRKVI